jgi:DNA polymerase-1
MDTPIEALIDGDILLHELGWSGEFKDKEDGSSVLLPYEEVQELLYKKIELIQEDTNTSRATIFFSDSEWINEYINKQLRKRGFPKKAFVRNFRYDVAKTKPYKGTRNNPKPFHFYNILADLLANYKCVISGDGLEADDMMSIEQYRRGVDTIICSRDKDLRICPGWHYSWECGKQRAIGPVFTDKIGWLEKRENDVLGYGLSFFYYQMLVGDTADNIPGLPKFGKVKAFDLLKDLKTEQELFQIVRDLYKESLGESSKEYFMEQANLLWIYQEKGVPYQLPKVKKIGK